MNSNYSRFRGHQPLIERAHRFNCSVSFLHPPINFLKEKMESATVVTIPEHKKDAEIEEAQNLRGVLSDKQLEKRGLCLAKLRVAGCVTGLGGRALLKLQHRTPENPLPAHRFSSGDIVAVLPSNTKDNQGAKQASTSREVPKDSQGVVYRVTANAITVAFEEFPEEISASEGTFSLHMLANDVTYRRLREAMTDLKEYSSHLKDVLFGASEPTFNFRPEVTDFTPVNPGMNNSQLEAIKLSLAANDVACIHGPPGTGKTTTVVEYIHQAVKRGQKVLACAPSNIAVDNIVEKLAESKLKIVRLGHPARLLPSVLSHSLDLKVSSHESTEIVKDVRRDMDDLLKAISNSRNKSERFKMRGDLKDLRKELQKREALTIEEIVKGSEVILATNVGIGDRSMKVLRDMVFDVVVLDEAAQALEASCWIPIMKAKKIVLAGDHLQLPPTIKSPAAEKQGLGVTLFDRVVKCYGDKVTRMLTVQYRMNESIMRWPSDELYGGKLEAHESVKSHLLYQVAGAAKNDDTEPCLIYVDTAGCGLSEMKEAEGDSTANSGEASIIVKHLEYLMNAGISPRDMAVITPYNAQVQLIRQMLPKGSQGLEVGSVDGFQGREKEAILISFVRSNDQREIGFLSENRRTNVAITRARRQLFVAGDSDTISINPFLKRFVEYLNENADLRNAAEYTEIFSGNMPSGPKEVSKETSQKGQAKIKPAKQVVPTPQKQRAPKDSATESKLDSRPPQRTQEEEAQIHSALEKRITDFLNDKNSGEIDFPASLSPYERMLVHEISEKLRLSHVSKGEGADRFIRVSKLNFVPPAAKPDSVPLNKYAETTRKPEPIVPNVEAANDMGTSNATAESSDSEQDDATNASKPVNQSKKKKKKKKPKKATPNNASQAPKPNVEKIPDDVDVDELLDQMIESNKKCAFKGCTSFVTTMGAVCEFCRKKFCLLHGMPEVHDPGCAAEIKKKARAEWLNKPPQSLVGKPTKTLSDKDRKVLHSQLKKKLDTAEASRLKKKDEKKK